MRQVVARGMALAMVLGISLASPGAKSADLGAYRGAGSSGVSGILATEAWLGHPLPRALDFLYFTNWGDCNTVQSPCSLGGWAIGQWAKQSRKMIFGLPLTACSVPYTGSCPKYTPLAEVAAGQHDSAYVYLGKTLVAKGMPDAVLRLGWEFNGGWYAWSAAGRTADWIAAFQHVVTVMRAVPGAKFRFDWNPAIGQLGVRPDTVYPGDAFVDLIGQDVYCQWWTPADQGSPAGRWNTLMNQGYGMAWHAAFAKTHGKPMSYPEWGTGTRPDGHGCTDDGYFVQQMWSWIAANPVEYHNYWDYPAPDYNGRLSDNHQPVAGGAFLQAANSGGPYPDGPLLTPTDPDMVDLAAAKAAWATLGRVLGVQP